jgi:hypothetical protein
MDLSLDFNNCLEALSFDWTTHPTSNTQPYNTVYNIFGAVNQGKKSSLLK